MSLLAVEALRKSFGGVRAVDGVSFVVEAGEIVALIGPNGAGKSTCFAMLAGQLRPDGGRIRLDGRDITGWGARRIWRCGVGRTFQVTATFASMTVRENVQMALIAHHGKVWRFTGAAAQRHRAVADALLAEIGMGAQADRAVAVLAYGDLKRAELAIALASEPRLLLMDEPAAGMAPAERESLTQLIRGLADRRGVAVLFTEHDMGVVFGLADRVIAIDHGAVITSGDPASVRADRRVQAVYLGEDVA